MSVKLSICVITMNRSEQLKEALESCLACQLPETTEFVIIDNASTDNTEDVVRELMNKSGQMFHYEKLIENIGAGAGRNRCFEKSKGEYIYGMDDDAVIDVDNNPDFFIRAIKIMDDNSSFATLATQIYDTAWKANRQKIQGKKISENLYKCKMFCGGSHFLRRASFVKPPYLSNKYGYEELPPSLMSYDMGMLNVFCPDLLVTHKPKIDKWDVKEDKNHEMYISGYASLFAIKKMMYPRIFYPLIFIANKLRIRRGLSCIPDVNRKCKAMCNYVIENCYVDYKLKIRTVIKLYLDFGLSVF